MQGLFASHLVTARFTAARLERELYWSLRSCFLRGSWLA
jgi:hypothetical protein